MGELIHSMFQNVLFPDKQNTGAGLAHLQLRKTFRFPLDPAVALSSLPWVVFDLETTGLNAKADQIIEIGAQKIAENRVIAEISTLVKCERALSPAVQKITGIKPEMLEGQPVIDEVLPKFLDFIQGSILVAHNAVFDHSFVVNACQKMNIELEWPTLCTLKMARDLLPDLESKTLDSLAEHFGLTFESRHRSIGDVKVTVGVLQAMLEDFGDKLETWRDFEPYRVAEA